MHKASLTILSGLALLCSVGHGLTGKFLYISDIHFDPLIDCERYNQTTYCRDPSLNLGVPEEVQQYYRRLAGYPSTDARVQISAPLSAGSSLGRYGCDSPYELMDAAYADAASVLPAPDFILYGGDVAAHSLNASMVRLAWETMRSVILARFGASVPVFVTIGNNDLGTHYLADCASADLGELAKMLAEWGWLPADQRGVFAQMGAYSRRVPGTGLRVLSLNTNIFTNKPVHVTPQEPSDCGQTAWLEKELEAAGAAGENVLLLGHIPAGTDSYNGRPLWNETYLLGFQKVVEKYVKRYPESVVYTTFGHVHKTEFRLMGDASAAPYNSIGVIGAVSPVYANNPMYRVMSYNVSAPHKMVDFEDHFMDLRASARSGSPMWFRDYVFSKAYEARGVTTQAVAGVIESARKSSVKLSEMMARSNSHYYEQESSIICIMTTNNKAEYDKCIGSWLG